MKLTKLSWSGARLEVAGLSVFIDPVEDFSTMRPYMGTPLYPVYPLSEGAQADVVLLTHLHPDHYDKVLIRKLLKQGGILLAPLQATEKLSRDSFAPTGLAPGQRRDIGGVRFTALNAMDGIGDEQVSWLIEALGLKVFHGGDTIWHSWFWKIGKQYGPIDVALLPINGVRVDYPFVGYPPIAASLQPEQAAVAARIMGVKNLVPMHYGQFHHPPVYCEYPGAKEAFEAACRRHHQPFTHLADGVSIYLEPNQINSAAH